MKRILVIPSFIASSYDTRLLAPREVSEVSQVIEAKRGEKERRPTCASDFHPCSRPAQRACCVGFRRVLLKVEEGLEPLAAQGKERSERHESFLSVPLQREV
jgi:hypothetical protein